MKEPILATFSYTELGRGLRCVVKGGLHHLRGNSQPYFSLTCDIYDGKEDIGGGAAHDTILAHRPEFADLAALHLSGWNGAPMHGEENGWYFARGGQWFGGSWLPMDSSYKTPATIQDRVESLMRHFRCDEDTARNMVALGEMSTRRDVEVRRYDAEMSRYLLERDSGIGVEPKPVADEADYKVEFLAIVEPMRPRWRREAVECVRKHKLSLYGDLRLDHERLLARMERGDFSLPSQHDLETEKA